MHFNTFQLSFCFNVSKFKAAKKTRSFYPNSRDRRIPKSMSQLGLHSEFHARASTKILNQFKPLWNTEWKIKSIFVYFSNLRNLMLTLRLQLSFSLTPFVMSRTVVDSSDGICVLCRGNLVLMLPLKATSAATSAARSVEPEGCWQGWRWAAGTRVPHPLPTCNNPK